MFGITSEKELTNKALKEYSEGNVEIAIQMLKEVLTKNSEYIEAMLNLGTIFCETNRPKNALELYLKAIEVEPNNGIAWYYLSITYGDLKQYMQALTASLNALVYLPANQKIWLNHGYLLEQAGIEITPKLFNNIKLKINEKRKTLGLPEVDIT